MQNSRARNVYRSNTVIASSRHVFGGARARVCVCVCVRVCLTFLCVFFFLLSPIKYLQKRFHSPEKEKPWAALVFVVTEKDRCLINYAP